MKTSLFRQLYAQHLWAYEGFKLLLEEVGILSMADDATKEKALKPYKESERLFAEAFGEYLNLSRFKYYIGQEPDFIDRLVEMVRDYPQLVISKEARKDFLKAIVEGTRYPRQSEEENSRLGDRLMEILRYEEFTGLTTEESDMIGFIMKELS